MACQHTIIGTILNLPLNKVLATNKLSTAGLSKEFSTNPKIPQKSLMLPNTIQSINLLSSKFN